MRKVLLGIAAVQLVAGMVAIPTVALAADNYNPRLQIPQHAQCGTWAASGSFGAFGKGNNFAGGANGPATGDSNADVCGNANAPG